MRTFIGALVFAVASTAWAQPPAPPQTSPGMPRNLQPPRAGTARLAGHVVAAETGRPLRRAVVRVAGDDPRDARSVSTEADGTWEIKELPAGKYSINVQKGGFVSVLYGQKRPFEQGKPVELGDGQSIDKLDVALHKGGVVTGRIVDEFGEPLAGARVSVMRHRFMQGQRRLVGVSVQGGSDVTDDIGQYRLHGLSPGEYYVSANINPVATLEVSADRTGYSATYYPGTPAASEAQRITVAVGQETSEINFALSPARVAKISGTVVGAAGAPAANTMVMLTSAGTSMGIGGSPLMSAALTKPDGTFTLSNVAAGDYRIEMIAAADVERIAQTGTNAGMMMTQAASVPVTVTGQDITNLVITMQPTSTASGKLVFDGDPPPANAMTGSIVFAMPATPTALPLGGNTFAKADGTFELKGLTGKRVIRANPPAGWYLKEVRVNGTDVIDSPVEFRPGEDLSGIEIGLTRTVATLTGTVQDAKGQPASDYVVVAFAADTRRWGYLSRFVRSARPDLKGGFTISGLPAEDYLVVAVEYLEPGEEGDPEVLERLRGSATRVTIADAQPKSITLKLAR
jgi:carboxypeptidase family protein